GVTLHRAELPNHVWLATEADPQLPVEHRTVRFELDERSDESEQRREHHQAGSRQQQVHQPLEPHGEGPALKSAGEDQRARLEQINGQTPRLLLEQLMTVYDLDTGRLEVQQRLHRKSATPI